MNDRPRWLGYVLIRQMPGNLCESIESGAVIIPAGKRAHEILAERKRDLWQRAGERAHVRAFGGAFSNREDAERRVHRIIAATRKEPTHAD